jgi:CDGSH-type Zn-finger protein
MTWVTNAHVVIMKDGPYVVTGNVSLTTQIIATDADGGSETWQEGETFSAPEKYALCRCGQSKSRPFCDGTHAKIGFGGTETASRASYAEQANAFDGPELRLTDVGSLCAFGRFCDPHGKVWNQVARTADPEVRATFIQQVENCPAGRLVAWDKETGKPVERILPIINRACRRPGGTLQRAGLAARRDPSGLRRWLRIRSAQPYHSLPLRSVSEQALLRWHARLGKSE